jgi:predicted AAA+ superfamily ATPase
MELLKQSYNSGKQANIYYWRDNKKNEIDCIIDGATPKALEIKSGKTFTKEYLKTGKSWLRTTTLQKDTFNLEYGGDESFSFLGTKIFGCRDYCVHLQ